MQLFLQRHVDSKLIMPLFYYHFCVVKKFQFLNDGVPSYESVPVKKNLKKSSFSLSLSLFSLKVLAPTYML